MPVQLRAGKGQCVQGCSHAESNAWGMELWGHICQHAYLFIYYLPHANEHKSNQILSPRVMGFLFIHDSSKDIAFTLWIYSLPLITLQLVGWDNSILYTNTRDAPNFRPPKIFSRKMAKKRIFGQNTFITETTRPKQKFVMTQTKSAASTRLSG